MSVVFCFIMLREIAESIKDFNSTISELLKNVEALLTSDVDKANIDRLRKRISFIKSSVGVSEPLSLSHKFFIDYRDEIKNRDEKFFINMDPKAMAKEYTKKKITSQDEFVFELVDAIKKSYNHASKAEKDLLYGDVKKLLKCAIEWKLHINASDK